MKSLTEAVLKLAPPGGLFNETVVGNLFPRGSDGARKQLVHRAVASGEIIRLKPGLFALRPEYRRSALPEVIASIRDRRVVAYLENLAKEAPLAE